MDFYFRIKNTFKGQKCFLNQCENDSGDSLDLNKSSIGIIIVLIWVF